MSKLTKIQKDDEKSGRIYFGGLPTDIDLDKLRTQYPEVNMKPGDVMTYEEIEKLLDLSWDSSRFRTVTGRWRRFVEKETNIVIDVVKGKKRFKVLSESEKVELTRKHLRKAGKSARRSYVINSRTDRKRVTEEERKILDHMQQSAAKVHAAAQLKQPVALPEL